MAKGSKGSMEGAEVAWDCEEGDPAGAAKCIGEAFGATWGSWGAAAAAGGAEEAKGSKALPASCGQACV